MNGVKMMQEILKIFRRNFPYIVRDDYTVLEILRNKDNHFIEKRNEKRELIAVSVINCNTVLLLCVDEEYRRQGIGSELLTQSENQIRRNGYKDLTVGVGFNYFMPGVPTSKRYFDAVNERLHGELNEEASNFFSHRGYIHSKNCNIFDMRFPLCDFDKEEYSVGDIIDGITYRFATRDDRDRVWDCTDDAYDEFTQWYKNEELYGETQIPKVLIATDEEKVLGALLVEVADRETLLGTIGCTSVRTACRGKHIARNMVTLATKYLKDLGMQEAYLSYTYSGLDKLYGYAGYKICVYYMMAVKSLDNSAK